MTSFDLDTMLKRLHLANARRVWRELSARAEKEQWTYDHMLEILFAEEVAHRSQTRLHRVSHAAKFPFLKTIDDFDFTFQSTLRMSMLGTFLSPDFVTEGGCLVLSGKPGRGKTHLAIAVAYRAIQNGFDAFFTTAAALIDELSVASRDGRLREALARYVQPSVLIIDELGYLTYGGEAANVLFHVVNERHLKKRAMVFTTNKSLKAWGDVLHDPDLAEAIVDRLLERGRALQLDGPSIRSKHVDSAALDSGVQPAIVSGTGLPDFPEPTHWTISGPRTRHWLEIDCPEHVVFRSGEFEAPDANAAVNLGRVNLEAGTQRQTDQSLAAAEGLKALPLPLGSGWRSSASC